MKSPPPHHHHHFDCRFHHEYRLLRLSTTTASSTSWDQFKHMISYIPKQNTTRSVATRATATKVAPKPSTKVAKAAEKKNNLTVLSKLADAGLLSQLEDLKVLSQLEKAGFSLSKIEEAGLLSAAEKSGALKFIADDSAPGTLSTLGFVLIAIAAGGLYAAPEGLTLAAEITAALTIPAGIAAIVGGNILSKIQKL